jgi:hypothetical protein
MKVEAQRFHLFTIDFGGGDYRRVAARFQLQGNRDVRVDIAKRSKGGD